MPPAKGKPGAQKAMIKKKGATTKKTTASKSTKERTHATRPTVTKSAHKFLQSTTPRWRDVFEAAANNDTGAVRYFINENEKLVRMSDTEEKTIALIAAENANLDLLKYVLEKDTTMLLYPDVFGNTVLQRAIEKNAIDMVKFLVEEQKWNITRPNEFCFGNTPIHVAAEEGQLEILKYFIEEKKGDPNLRNASGEPPAFLAADQVQLEIIKYLLEECKADMTALNNHRCNILYGSAKKGDVTIPKYLLDEHKLPFDINWRDMMNATILYTATRFTKYDFIHYIVEEHHADINIPDELERSPLHVAAYQNNYPMCKFFVDHGADLEARDAYGKTALQEASDPVVIGFLDDMINVQRRERAERGLKRNRRNVPGDLFVPHIERPQTVERWSRKAISANLALGNDTNEIGFGSLNDFLVVADTVLKYTRGRVSQRRISYRTPSLAAESIRNRIDPSAIVINDQSFL